ncbi:MULTISPECIES: ribosome assembly RNA-binding protein YhbY [Clostridium]|uniref:ribosome assembly RNA-binding protein YhbY n=1 Tax=Clostridium TaxID=1485 RepID=UPI00069E71D3|nr:MULTISPECIES: ribosome assembly RNA-binding protein YhbY [Clostridium]KOF56729.1 RNA-binding protein [Clostridium sp. DMHC 10]MCD2347546.1 ribosome assembly RNA-binding protein YhbY [Clostridium guangxiense]
MLTGKQRAFLRSMANTINPIFQLGKNGIDETFLKQIDDALEARELIKINILENSEFTPREASDVICSKLNSEGIQAIGRKLVLYRKSKKKPKIEIPK